MIKTISTKKPIRVLIFMLKTGAPIGTTFKFLFDYLGKKINSQPNRLEIKGTFNDFISNKKFSTDWFTGNIETWNYIFEKYCETHEVREALEIGSWEGLASNFILWKFEQVNLTCVDTWQGADEHDKKNMSEIEEKFDSNMVQFKKRVKKVKSTSYQFFIKDEKYYDVIYIDGSHHVDDVMIDSVNSFRRLKNNGVMIFDDYLWIYYRNLLENPATAINCFLKLKKGQYKLLSVGYQIIIQKISTDHD